MHSKIKVLKNMWTSFIKYTKLYDKLKGTGQWTLLVKFPFSLKNNVTLEGAISHNVLYYMYQQLSIAHYQVSFHANNCFE